MRIAKFLIFIILFLFPFGQLTKIPLGVSVVSLYLQDLGASLLLFWWTVNCLLKRRSFPRPPLMAPILAFAGVSLFSLLVNSSRLNIPELLISFLYLLRWGIYAGIYFVVYGIAVNSQKSTVQQLLKLLTLVGITLAIFGLTQYFLYPNLRNLYYLGWDPHQYRVFGTFLDPGFTGIILVLTLILLLCFKTLKQNLRMIGGLLVFLALMLTYSRSSYLALVSAVTLLALFKKTPKVFLVAIFLLVFSAIFLPRPTGEGVRLERRSTILARAENWRQTLKIIRDHPIFGVGFNTLRFVKRDYGFLGKDWQEVHSGAGEDSSLLFVWATTGFFGLLVYLWMWWKAVQNSKFDFRPRDSRGRKLATQSRQTQSYNSKLKAKKDKETKEDFYLCILAGTVALFVHSLFLNSLFYPWVTIWVWILLGLAHSAVKVGERR